HSNETKWPWYSNIAPISWLVQYDTMKGRSEMNFSEWGTKSDEADEAAEAVSEGEMPPATYLVAHPEARLNSGERAALIDGLNATFASKHD
ncbi:MAG: heme-binding domain-containing protein, partial [candidate division KSB1 bacterium]